MRVRFVSVSRVVIACVCALPASRAVARGGVSDSPDSAHADAVRRDAATLFADEFRGSAIDAGCWSVASGVRIEAAVSDRGTTRSAARLSRFNGRESRVAVLRSVAVPLGAAHGAELKFAALARGVDAGDWLSVEYLGNDDQWRVLERIVSDGRRARGFSQRFRALPEDALHDGFEFRFRAELDDERESWLIADVALVEFEPVYSLTIGSHPVVATRVTAFSPDDDRKLDGTTPLARSMPAKSRVRLAAAPTAEGLVFSHWTVDGLIQANRKRVLALELGSDTEAVAHYRRWVSGRGEIGVRIYAIPDGSMPIAAGLAPDLLYTNCVPSGEFRCLTGETILLSAPPRTETLALAGWVVGGRLLPGGESVLALRVSGAETILAEYVLLGDMNGDGRLDKYDVDVFLEALVAPSDYALDYPDLDRVKRGDINGDDLLDVLDIEAFVDLMIQGRPRR